MASILEPSEVVLPPVYQLPDFALKSPMATIKKGLVVETASGLAQSYCRSFQSHLRLIWNLCKEIKLQILSPNFLSKVIHSLLQILSPNFISKVIHSLR